MRIIEETTVPAASLFFISFQLPFLKSLIRKWAEHKTKGFWRGCIIFAVFEYYRVAKNAIYLYIHYLIILAEEKIFEFIDLRCRRQDKT